MRSAGHAARIESHQFDDWALVRMGRLSTMSRRWSSGVAPEAGAREEIDHALFLSQREPMTPQEEPSTVRQAVAEHIRITSRRMVRRGIAGGVDTPAHDPGPQVRKLRRRRSYTAVTATVRRGRAEGGQGPHRGISISRESEVDASGADSSRRTLTAAPRKTPTVAVVTSICPP
jgi:hypothetical protein